MTGSATAFDDQLLLTNDFGDVALARRFARDVLARFGYRGCPDPVVLVVSELVTNAVQHGRGGTRLRLRGNSSALRIEVGDRRPGFGRRDEQGWGLRLTDMFATRWGATPYGAGKIVWCVIRAKDCLCAGAGQAHEHVAGHPVEAAGR